LACHTRNAFVTAGRVPSLECSQRGSGGVERRCDANAADCSRIHNRLATDAVREADGIGALAPQGAGMQASVDA
jgi:hypothetical protein